MGLGHSAMEPLPTPPFIGLFTDNFVKYLKLHHSIELVVLILMHTILF